jgi:hypothetical protein
MRSRLRRIDPHCPRRVCRWKSKRSKNKLPLQFVFHLVLNFLRREDLSLAAQPPLTRTTFRDNSYLCAVPPTFAFAPLFQRNANIDAQSVFHAPSRRINPSAVPKFKVLQNQVHDDGGGAGANNTPFRRRIFSSEAPRRFVDIPSD